jgi:RNA polymerase sigma-70 factor (ECF subfamily)
MMEESELILRAKQGDLDAFNQLVLHYQTQVYNLACRMMSDTMLADDVTQDTFISAYRHINSFRGGSFRAWLLRIASNNCYDELRRVKRKPDQPLYPIDPESGEENEDPVWLSDNGDLPEDFIHSKELEDAIQRCIDQLQSQFKAVLIMVDVQGMDYQEASQAAAAPIGTVRSRLARAREKIQRCLHGFSELLPDKYRLNDGSMQ